MQVDKYSKDDSFKARARLHQSHFRSQSLKVDCDYYGNLLKPSDAKRYLNFYPNLNVIEVLKKRYPKYSKGLYANMLRSEHIPFNIFAPLIQNKLLAKHVLVFLLTDLNIHSVTNIFIEYAPSPSSQYLNDKTSFDVYVEYLTENNEQGVLGIEVKYTEQAYKLKLGSKEAVDINDINSKYQVISNAQDLFIPGAISTLKSDKLRQIWRNHLLGESMLIHPQSDIKHFKSIIIYPAGNKHFVEAIPEYQTLLKPAHKEKLCGITFEMYFDALARFIDQDVYKDWLHYINSRYIIPTRIN